MMKEILDTKRVKITYGVCSMASQFSNAQHFQTALSGFFPKGVREVQHISIQAQL